jgi:hypothetical protein
MYLSRLKEVNLVGGTGEKYTPLNLLSRDFAKSLVRPSCLKMAFNLKALGITLDLCITPAILLNNANAQRTTLMR